MSVMSKLIKLKIYQQQIVLHIMDIYKIVLQQKKLFFLQKTTN